MREHMCVRMPRELWRELELDDYRQLQRVRYALYSGYSIEELRRLCKQPFDSFETKELQRVAPLVGITDEDVVILKD